MINLLNSRPLRPTEDLSDMKKDLFPSYLRIHQRGNVGVNGCRGFMTSTYDIETLLNEFYVADKEIEIFQGLLNSSDYFMFKKYFWIFPTNGSIGDELSRMLRRNPPETIHYLEERDAIFFPRFSEKVRNWVLCVLNERID